MCIEDAACQGHLQLCFSCASTLGKNVNDDVDAVDDWACQGGLQIALLDPAELCIDKHPATGQSNAFQPIFLLQQQKRGARKLVP